MFEEQNSFTDMLFCDPPQEMKYPSLYMIGVALHAVGVAGLLGIALEAIDRILVQ